jgi:membrane protein DedA with SNARE-associated domain
MHSFILANQHWLARLGASAGTLIERFGGLGMMLLAIGDSSFFTFPEVNDILIVVFSIGKPWRQVAYYDAMTILGSVIGCLLLYSVGRKGGSPILRRRFSKRNIERAERLFEKYGVLTVVIPSILPPPMPFKIFVLSAGVFRLNWSQFLIAVVIGRTLRYSIWAILAVLYGDSVKQYMQKNLNMIGMVLLGFFAIALVGSIAFYWHRRKESGNGKEL